MKCLKCGDQFVAKRKNSMFCSAECKKAYRYKKICIECGREFEAVGQKTRFCSYVCGSKNMHRKAFKTVSCSRCGVEFLFKGTTTPKYCVDCRKARNVELVLKHRVSRGMQNSKNIGIGRGKWQRKGDNATTRNREGIHQIEKVYYSKCLERFGVSRCVVCQSDEDIHVHHIDHDPTNNEMSNLVFLCRFCHVRHHWKRTLTTEHILNCIFEALKPHSYRC